LCRHDQPTQGGRALLECPSLWVGSHGSHQLHVGLSSERSLSGKYVTASGSVTYGSLQMDFDLVGDPTYATGGSDTVGINTYWINTLTINPANPALIGTPGTVRIAYGLKSSVSVKNVGRYAALYYLLYVDSYFNAAGSYTCPEGMYSGSPMSDHASFTVDIPMIFGTPFTSQTELDVNGTSGPYGGYASETLHATLTSGSITVLDNSGNAVAYSSSSSIGASRGASFASGDSYAGFALTNTTGYQTTMALLDGTAGSNEMITASYIAIPDTNVCVSDAVDLSGMHTNHLFVLQMSYNPLAALAKLGDTANAMLMLIEPATKKLVNAVEGNSDGGLARHFVQGAYNAATNFQRSTFGVDTNLCVAWAVLDHNSQFVVGQVATPPTVRWTGITPGTNSGMLLTLNGPANNHYLIESAYDLTATNWDALGMMGLDTNGTGIFKDPSPVPANSLRFYRARQ
jgi:hypothetical protein